MPVFPIDMDIDIAAAVDVEVLDTLVADIIIAIVELGKKVIDFDISKSIPLKIKFLS